MSVGGEIILAFICMFAFYGMWNVISKKIGDFESVIVVVGGLMLGAFVLDLIL